MPSKKPKARRTTKSGRSAENKKHVRFHQWMMETQAFKSLDPFEVRILLELYALYSGFNNGHLFLSVREAASRCKMSKDTASRCFKVLQERGFIRRRADEPENYHLREANHWILTEFGFGKLEASKDFLNRTPEKQNARPKSRTARPKSGTETGVVANDSCDASDIQDRNIVFFPKTVPDSGHR